MTNTVRAAAALSHAALGLPLRDVGRIRDLFRQAGLPTQVRLTPAQRVRLFRAMRLDKKVRGGEIRFVLAERIGKVRWGLKVPEQMVAGTLEP